MPSSGVQKSAGAVEKCPAIHVGGAVVRVGGIAANYASASSFVVSLDQLTARKR